MRTDIALKPVNAAYAKLGVTGCNYQPLSGDAVTGLTCMFAEPDVSVGFDNTVRTPEREVRVRASELSPSEGGRFTINGRIYKVLGVPEAVGRLRLEWRCVVKDVTP